MSRPLWFVSLVRKLFPGRFLLAKSTKLPLWGRFVHAVLFKDDDLMVIPTTRRVIEVNQDLAISAEVVLPTQVVEHFIDIADVHWIMDRCLCRQADKCKNYPIDLGCLFLGKAVLDINPKLGRRVTNQEASAHVQRCRDAGLVHTIGRNKLDTVWMGVGPGTRLFTICNCCPCCCLWRALPHFANHIQRKLSRMPGIFVSSSADCVGCGICVANCFMHAVTLDEGRAIVGDECRGCGNCVSKCPQAAMSLTIKDRSSVDAAVARLSPLVEFE